MDNQEKVAKESALDEIDGIDAGKRHFLKKVLIGSVFAIPVIQSFSMKKFRPQIPAALASA